MPAAKLLAEGLGLGALLVLICALGIRGGAVGMVHLYDRKVQDRAVSLGLVTREGIRKRGAWFRLLCLPMYIVWVLVSAYAVNGARGFFSGFWQMLVILSVMNLIDRLLIDEFWVGHTKAWIIPGTEDLRPYTASSVRWRRTTSWRCSPWRNWKRTLARESRRSKSLPAIPAGRTIWTLPFGTEQRSAGRSRRNIQIRPHPTTVT